MQSNILLQKLPPFRNQYDLVTKRQTVRDIVKEVVYAHRAFVKDYDRIANEFYYSDPLKTFKALFSFLKGNIQYVEETEDSQTVTSPAGLLTIGEGDCKHYASFIGGVLDALKRQGMKIDWFYRFASYDPYEQDPGHVFVVANYNGKEIWIDPVLRSFDQRLNPTFIIDKKLNVDMPLYRVSGVDEYAATIDSYQDDDGELDPDFVRAIQLLLHYGVLNTAGKINDNVLDRLHSKLTSDVFQQIVNARVMLHNAALGGFFKNIFRGIKKVALFPLRNAFLGLVRINAFGYATKLNRSVFDEKGNYTEFKDKLKKLWQDKFGGDWTALQKAFVKGSRKKAILGSATVGVAAAIPAWVATASAVIAAIMPLVNAFLKQKQAQAGGSLPGYDISMYPYGVCADGVTPKAPDGSCPNEGVSNGSAINWVKENPVMAAGLGVGAFYLFKKFF